MLAVALEQVLRYLRVTVRELEKLMGHVTYTLLFRRELMSLFAAVYRIIATAYHERQPLWPSAWSELEHAWALLPTVWAELRLPWRTSLQAMDASPFGYGIVERQASAPGAATGALALQGADRPQPVADRDAHGGDVGRRA